MGHKVNLSHGRQKLKIREMSVKIIAAARNENFQLHFKIFVVFPTEEHCLGWDSVDVLRCEELLNDWLFLFALHIHRKCIKVTPFFGQDHILKKLKEIVVEIAVYKIFFGVSEFLFALFVQDHGCRKILTAVTHWNNAAVKDKAALEQSVFNLGDRNAFFFDFDDGISPAF